MLAQAIESARRRLGLNSKEFAAARGHHGAGAAQNQARGGVNGDTLARLQELGGVRITKKLIRSLAAREAKAA
jgi:hypothetical protein